MALTEFGWQLSFSLLAENRADIKGQNAARSALSSASCQRSGCSPAEPYPLHECLDFTLSDYPPLAKGTSLFCRIGDISTLH